MAKISLNSHVNSLSGDSWTLQTIDSIKYFVSKNKTSSSVSSIKCSFTTPYDNINVVVEIGSSSESNYDWCYIGKLDDSNAAYNNYLDRISGIVNNGPKFKTVTINVAKAGTHFLIIGYRKDSSGNVGNDCGYFRLITTEVEKQENSYIYCGTKTTVVSEEPIVFSKDGTTNDKFIGYNDPNNMFQWQTDFVDDNYYSTKVSFKTTSDNTEITLIYKYYFNNSRSDRFYVSFVDTNLLFNANDYIYQTGINLATGTVTKKISIPKAGDHYINIGFYFYHESYVSSYVYVGFSGTNVIKDTKILTPVNILANNEYINKVYVGSELIWRKSIIPNTISWKTLTWDKSNNTYTYNTKGKLYIKYSYDNHNYETYLLSSPASVPHPNEITKVEFYNINSYQGNSYNCTYKLDLSGVNTYKFNSMYNMFNNCYSLTSLDVSNFNTSNVTDMWTMFNNCYSLTSLDVSKWDTSKVTSIGNIFRNCSSLTSLDVSKWNTSKVTNMQFMFYNCSSLTSLDVSKWNTSNVTGMYAMFYHCSSLTSLDVSNFNTSKVTSMYAMFENCSSLTSLDMSKWDTSKVTSIQYMFFGCNNLTSLDVSNFNTSNVPNMYAMFYNCSSLTSLDVSKWNTSKVTDMQFMFSECNNLTSLDLSKWDVSNVTNIDNIFYNSSSLTTLIDGHESDSYIKALNKLKVNIDLSDCVKLNYKSVYALFRGVATVTGKTITLPSVMKGKLDAAKVKIATDKGWTVRYN